MLFLFRIPYNKINEVYQMKTKVLYQGVDTGFGGGSLFIALCSNIKDLTGYTLTFKLQNITKTFTDITARKISFNLTAEETSNLKLGKYQSSIEVLDPSGNVFANFTDTLFDIRRNPNA